MSHENVELVGGDSILKGDKEVLRFKVKEEDRLVLFQHIDKSDEKALDILIEAARKSGYSLVNIEEISRKWKEGMTEVLVWDYAHDKFVPIQVIIRQEKKVRKRKKRKKEVRVCLFQRILSTF